MLQEYVTRIKKKKTSVSRDIRICEPFKLCNVGSFASAPFLSMNTLCEHIVNVMKTEYLNIISEIFTHSWPQDTV